MAPNSRFAIVFALCIAIAIAATAGAISLSSDRDALQLDELLQAEEMPEGPPGSLEDHLRWTFEIFGGQRRWTDNALNERFTSGFAESFEVSALNAGLDQLFNELGPIHFHRITDKDETVIRALAAAEDGTPITIWLSVADGGQVESMTLDEVSSQPRLPPWQATLVIVATWSFLAAALAAARAHDHVQAWVLLAAVPLVASSALLLGASRAAYTTGRVVPPVVVPVVIWLLARPLPPKAARALVGCAGVAAVVGMTAPLTRDASLIGHPSLYGSLVDSETSYRLLQAVWFGVGGAAFIAVVVAALGSLKRSARHYRSHRWSVAFVAAAWSLGAVGSSIDYGVGTGGWAHGSLAAARSSALALVPATVVVGLVASRWERPGIERLVIDLEADDTRLAAAVAAALEDPTLDILTSPDGHRFTTEHGADVDLEELGPTQVLTEIRSGPRLVGALVHDAALRHDPQRLQAVAAAAGLALDVNRLNQQVTAQLEEVNASRARIVHASDTARRHVARDLHDGAQQRLVALGLHLQRARRLARSGRTGDLVELLDDATNEVRDTIDEIRAVSRGAQPALLAERGLEAAVDALAERSSVPVDIDIEPISLSADIESTAYFVVAEGLTNVAKHANATQASVAISRENGQTSIRIDDDGSGGARPAAGSGLEGLNDRVAACGGTFLITSTATGTTLQVTLPCG